MTEMSPTRRALLATAFHRPLSAPNIEAAFERFQALISQPVEFAAFCEAVGACLRDGLIREPVRLPEGALQCHWQLDLTPLGVATARTLVAGD